jgi:hypothetical protein
MAVDIMNDGLSLVLGLSKCLVTQLDLMSQVIDVSLQSMDLLNASLLSVLNFSETQLKPVVVLLKSLHAGIGFLVLLSDLSKSFIESFGLQARLSVVSKYIVFLHLQCT